MNAEVPTIEALVTGAAGFIASHLVDRLLADGWTVRAVDCLTDTYDPDLKRRNLPSMNGPPRDRYRFLEQDLRTADIGPLVDGVDVVFHHSAIPGVRASWSSQFPDYVEQNVNVTHRLLEAARRIELGRFVYASSSSVYGNALRYPSRESDVPHPHSPYGVTKLAAEHLCVAYAGNFGVPTVSLRYFSVYGPRQRPDMGVGRIIRAGLGRGTFSVYGTGAQLRDMTYVGDVVDANLKAAEADLSPGTVMNVAGGSEVSVNDVIEEVGEILQVDVPIQWASEQPGDVYRTGGATELARELLGWEPRMSLEDGLRAQVEWEQSRPEA